MATAASSGTPVAAERRAYRMEYRMSDGDEPVRAMTLMVNGDTVRTMLVDTLRRPLSAAQVTTRRIASDEGFGTADAVGVQTAGPDYRASSINATALYDPEIGAAMVGDTGRGFRIVASGNYREVMVFVNGERVDASYLDELDPSKIESVKWLRTDDQFAPFGEKAAEGKIGVAIVLKMKSATEEFPSPGLFSRIKGFSAGNLHTILHKRF